MTTPLAHPAAAEAVLGGFISPVAVPASAAASAAQPMTDSPPTGSRRRRIWELSPHAHCPVVGVCLPMAALRQLINKLLGAQTHASDYELYCGVNSECKQRNRVSEQESKALDRRYALSLRQAQPLEHSNALAAWWHEQTEAGGVAVQGALWAVLTHPNCDAALEEQVLQEIHMLQHQNGADERADLQQLCALLHENQVLARELGAVQQRCTLQAKAQARKIESLQAELMRARADLIGRDTVVASLRDELRHLEATVPGLRTRDELARQSAQQIERIQDLDRALLRMRCDKERVQRRAEDTLQALPLRSEAVAQTAEQAERGEAADDSAPPLTPLLAEQRPDRAILCVGGRLASVPAYRALIEQTGGRFLHHDGGEADSVARLDHSLAAADLVICQTGCISHDAYWRVMAHCKRTGKRCLFVEKPSQASLRRALVHLLLAPALVPPGSKPDPAA